MNDWEFIMPGSPTSSIVSDTNFSIGSSFVFVDVSQVLQESNRMSEEAFTDIKDDGSFVSGEADDTQVHGPESIPHDTSSGIVAHQKNYDASLTEVTQALRELTCHSKGKNVSQDLFQSLEQTKYRLQLLQEELKSCRFGLGLPMVSKDSKIQELTSGDTLQIHRTRLIQQLSAILDDNAEDSDGSISTFHSEGSCPDTEEVYQDSSLNLKPNNNASTARPSTTNRSQSWSAVEYRPHTDRMISIGLKTSCTQRRAFTKLWEEWQHEDWHGRMSRRKKVQGRSSRGSLQPSSASIRSLPREMSWVVEEESKMSCPGETTIGSSTATKRGLLAVKSDNGYDDLPRIRRRRAVLRPSYRGARLQPPSPSIKSLPREICWNVQDGDP